MQKRSHKLLASALLQSQHGFTATRFEWAFLFGAIQPDFNPLTHLKGTFRAHTFGGHRFSNSQPYIAAHIHKLQQCSRWTVWQYYTLGKLTHYLADAFTYPHNDHWTGSLLAHHQYERALRLSLIAYLKAHKPQPQFPQPELVQLLTKLHREYMTADSEPQRDVIYILQTTTLLMASFMPTRP